MVELEYAEGLTEDSGYAFATGSIRVLETRLLTGAQLARLAEAADPAEAWRLLAEAGLAMAAETGWQEYEAALAQELERLYQYARSVSPKPEVVAWLKKRYDFHNLKVFLKAHFLEEDPREAVFGVGEVPAELIAQAVKTAVWSALPEELARAGEAAVAEYERTKAAQAFDFVVDREMFAHLRETARQPFLRGLVELWCDLANLKSALRAKGLGKDRAFLARALVPPGSIPHDRLLELLEFPLEEWPESLKYTPYARLIAAVRAEAGRPVDLGQLDRLSDNFVLARLRATRFSLYGPEPLVAYILAKEMELKAVRIIMVGKINGLPPEELKERLRTSYA
ncbi:MAG: V-type ATPase subunit [Candidatus Acetothermia bacterium]|nr:V-type ATPase subunit [Candidatus Acetothermia bacterium]MDH7505753.1 V-type ATPase subunit [Candidatus Acetothermia bacterium]